MNYSKMGGTLVDAWEETSKREQEIAIKNLRFPDRDLEMALEQVEKDLREKGHAILHLPEHVKRRENRDSLYIMQPVLNHYRELRGAPPIYLF